MSKITITYDVNGGTSTSGLTSWSTNSGVNQIDPRKPVRRGYTFLGYNTNKNATTATYLAGYNYNITQSLNLYAIWKTQSSSNLTIKWESNGHGSVSPSQTTISAWEPLTVSDFPTVTPSTGYEFYHWEYLVYASSSDGSPGNIWVYEGDSLDQDYTIYAWFKQIYVSFNANSGTGAPSSVNVSTSNGKATIPSGIPTKTGKAFLGWADSSNATEPQYLAGNAYPFIKSQTLYAVWGNPNYILTFDPGDGVITTSNTLEVEQGLSVKTSNLTPPIPVRDGYYFAGWYTSSSVRFDVSTVYDDSITFYAKWINGVLWDYLPIVVDGTPTAMKPYIVADGEWVPIGPKVYTASEWKRVGCPASLSPEPSIVYVSVPTQVNSLTYNGEEQTPVFNQNDDYVFMAVEPETDAGTYSATCALIPSQDEDVVVKWADGTTDNKMAIWTINKAQGVTSVPANDGYNLEIGTPVEIEVESNVPVTATIEPSSVADVEVTEVQE